MKYQVVLGLTALLVCSVFCDEEPAKGVSAADVCQPGQKYNVGCNECVCPENGSKTGAICTLKICTEDPSVPAQPQQEEKCEPGSTYQLDSCNTCTCPENGKRSGAACTAIACDTKA